MSLASSSRRFAAASTSSCFVSAGAAFAARRPATLSQRAFAKSPVAALAAPSPTGRLSTSTGQEPFRPNYTPSGPGGENSKSTEPRFRFADYSSQQAKPYPFSATARIPYLPPLPQPKTEILPPAGTNLMQHVHTTLQLGGDPNSFHHLFNSKRNPTKYIRPGSVVQVSHYPTLAKTRLETFTGVLIATRRRGHATSFILRNVLLRTGVEMKFFTSSPLLKQITLIKQADGKPGNLRRARRAKLYYYRDQPHRLNEAISAVRAMRKNQRQESGTAFI